MRRFGNAQRNLVALAAVGLFLVLGLSALPGSKIASQVVRADNGVTVTPVTAVPSPVPVVEPQGDPLSVLLIGSDTSNPVNAGRTDTLMVALVHRDSATVNLLSIPRDLFVYIPGYGMGRINTAFGLGEHSDLEGGGYELLKEVLAYNLGLDIDFYARVDFNGFQSLINALGGIDITVDCALQDWQLISPELDPSVEDNWELVTLSVGIHHLDGYEALWYARSRRTSSDFDRGRRQQALMRAIWRRVNELGLVSQIPALWSELLTVVETDMELDDMLSLVPMALQVDEVRIRQFRFNPEVHVRGWRTPGGAAVQVPVGDQLEALLQRFLQPITDNLLVAGRQRVEIENRTGYQNMDVVVADMLAWHGFDAVALGNPSSEYTGLTRVYDLSGRRKGGRLDALLDALQLDADLVTVLPSTDATADYRVVLGSDFRSCQHNVAPPVDVAITPP